MDNPFGKVEKAEAEVEEVKVARVVEAAKAKETVELKPKQSRKQAILESYGGLESNVPINSPYWKS